MEPIEEQRRALRRIDIISWCFAAVLALGVAVGGGCAWHSAHRHHEDPAKQEAGCLSAFMYGTPTPEGC